MNAPSLVDEFHNYSLGVWSPKQWLILHVIKVDLGYRFFEFAFFLSFTIQKKKTAFFWVVWTYHAMVIEVILFKIVDRNH